MNTKHPDELAYLLASKKLDPKTLTIVNEVVYWYDPQEIDRAIEHAKVRLKNPHSLAKTGYSVFGGVRSVLTNPLFG